MINKNAIIFYDNILKKILIQILLSIVLTLFTMLGSAPFANNK